MFIWETVDKKYLLVVSEYDKKEYDFSSELIKHEVFFRRTVDKTYLLVMSENDVELLTNVLPLTRIELAKQDLTLILVGDLKVENLQMGVIERNLTQMFLIIRRIQKQ